MKDFEINDLYFTAPTFITRLDGNTSWNPEGKNDGNDDSCSDLGVVILTSVIIETVIMIRTSVIVIFLIATVIILLDAPCNNQEYGLFKQYVFTMDIDIYMSIILYVNYTAVLAMLLLF